MTEALDLFDTAPESEPITGTTTLGGRLYEWTLYPSRMPADWRTTQETRAPGQWRWHVTFESYGTTRELRRYDRRDELWKLVREGL